MTLSETHVFPKSMPCPCSNFLPGSGTLRHLSPPEEVPGVVRVDTGVVEGDNVSVFYDPMISKLIVWGNDRREALLRMRNALRDYHVSYSPPLFF